MRSKYANLRPMAGGMYPRRDRPTLAERKVITERIEANRAASAQRTPATDRPGSAGHRPEGPPLGPAAGTAG